MKRFLRSKLVQALVTLVILASAIVIPLSHNILHSHAAPTSSQSSWNIIPSPSPFASVLLGVTSFSATNAWAVGSSNGTTLIEHWDGKSWTQQTASTGIELFGVK